MATGRKAGSKLRAVPTPPTDQPPAEVAQHPIENLTDVVLSCRSDGHRFPYGHPTLDRWNRHRDPQTGRVTSASRSMMCDPANGGCGTIVRDVIERGAPGMRQRQYTHPEGYSMPPGQAITRREARAELMERVFVVLDAEDDKPAGRPATG